MEKGRRIHPSGRRTDRHPHCYSFLNAYTLADNDSQQDGYLDAYSYIDEDANSYEDSICYRYPIVFALNGAGRVERVFFSLVSRPRAVEAHLLHRAQRKDNP
jgi:hypothetical protein